MQIIQVNNTEYVKMFQKSFKPKQLIENVANIQQNVLYSIEVVCLGIKATGSASQIDYII